VKEIYMDGVALRRRDNFTFAYLSSIVTRLRAGLEFDSWKGLGLFLFVDLYLHSPNTSSWRGA
jgi:hypothetical protein